MKFWNKKMFFGWENIKWFLKEILNMYSSKTGFFSKKRIESGIAFIILQWGMVYWLELNVEKITSSDLFIWATIECVICGYTLSKIESGKVLDKTSIVENTTTTTNSTIDISKENEQA